LSGTNTYSGVTTIAAGTVIVNGALVSASGVLVSGGILKGTGTVSGPVTVANGGTVAPGSSPGVIHPDAVAFNNGAIFSVELGGTSPGSGTGFHDQLDATGSVTIGESAVLNVSAF